MNLKYFLLGTSLFAGLCTAQNIDFEAQQWKALGVYDTWEQSPFRTKVLNGNAAVIDNPTKTEIDPIANQALNTSDKVLAVQRSRFGSNTFGARIDLPETFELTPTQKYIHLWVNRPKSGRVMVVGLGKRKDRAGQSPETEQFWAMTTSEIEGGAWREAVVPFKGNGGIDIYSLVVVPDCESPHNLTEDFVAYVDNISISDSPTPQLISDYYYINFDKKQKYTRTDRYISGVNLTTDMGRQNFTVPEPRTIYTDAKPSFVAKAGEEVTAAINYHGTWMHGYVYLDADNDGQFSTTEPGEMVSFSYLNGVNSANQTISDANTMLLPKFTLPAHLTPGFYRLRYKVDWDNGDPAGNAGQSNNLLENGGGFVDIRLNIHASTIAVNDAQRNGYVSTADGRRLIRLEVPFGEDFKIKMNPENGFEYAGIIVKHGYNLSGDSLVKGNVQWERTFFSRNRFDETDHTFTIPGEYMNGDVEIEGLFIEQGTYVPIPIPTRYATTTIKDGQFDKDTPWHTLLIGQSGHVIAENGASAIPLNNTTVDTDNPAQLWCFVGNEEDGYRLYNCKAGATKVLAAPTTMLGNTGDASYPTLQPADRLPEGYTDVWMFADSPNIGEGKQFAYLYEKGFPAHKVNNRNSKLAFWNGGADAGSTLTVGYARNTIPTSISAAKGNKGGKTRYHLDGKLAKKNDKGLLLQKGSKVFVR